ncbi:UNVERIFIED_CONTAM: hypothetical protein H355_015678 [Colinus virginianus]|nr:hypothetical protein H355_015678 [Colinus virginianus]
MGSEWVGVANDLFRSCRIDRRVERLSECGADAFVGLYESVLGEQVPDLIAAPRSQEDDAHNVQAVIDSLALDYLQVSLSHITDETRVLPNSRVQIASPGRLESSAGQLTPPSKLSSVDGSESECFVPSCDVDGSGSTSELLRLGDTARSFSERGEDLIAAPRSQEDDAHNVQAVIDSLALDYLQVSLSHITGENIVKGDRESIRNLLEIFDGLLEYLTEEASESSSQNGDETRVLPNSRVQIASPGRLESSAGQLTPPSKLSSVDGYENSTVDPLGEPLSHRTTKENLAQQELHHVSQKLARRLNEVDSVVAKAYENELRIYEAQERLRLSKLKEEVKELVQQALKKHELLVAIIKKDRDHNKRLHEFKQRIYRQKWTQNKVREKRQQAVRARKYYEDYRVQLRARMMRARTREERIFKNLFEEGLEIQKQRLKDLRAYAQEMRAQQRREHQNELESMENYYRDQFSMLAEALSQERQEIQTREKAQAQMLQKTKRELRSRMEKEIQQLQSAIMQNDDETFFQELEADRLRARLQMASFQYNRSGFS